MSLTGTQFIFDISDPEANLRLDSFFSKNAAPTGILFRGDEKAVPCYFMIPNPDSTGPLYIPSPNINPANLSMAIGDADKRPTGGTFFLSVGGSDTSALAYNISEANLKIALNALTTPSASTVGATNGGIATVEIKSPGVYRATFTNVGPTGLTLTGEGAGLDPESTVNCATTRPGTSQRKEQWTIELIQRPYVYATSFTETEGPGVEITEMQAGDDDHKAMFAIRLTPTLYAGSFRFLNSGAIRFDSNEDDFESAAPNWTALKTGDSSWTIERITVGAQTLTESDFDLTNLKAYVGYLMTLSLTASSLRDRFYEEGVDTFETTMEFRHGGLNSDILYHASITLSRDILSGAIAPSNFSDRYYTAEEVRANFLQFLYEVTDLTGGGSTKLDGVATAALSVPRVVSFVKPGTGLLVFELGVGTDTEDVGSGIVRPDDYATSTNEKVWRQKL